MALEPGHVRNGKLSETVSFLRDKQPNREKHLIFTSLLNGVPESLAGVCDHLFCDVAGTTTSSVGVGRGPVVGQLMVRQWAGVTFPRRWPAARRL